MNYPHENVYIRLGVSTVQGVGVFAIRDIPKGTNLNQGDDCGDLKEIPVSEIECLNLPMEILDLYKDFLVMEDGHYYAPKTFNIITPSWYFNHSDTPNVGTDEGEDFYALRDIKKGEELFANYSTYDEGGVNFK